MRLFIALPLPVDVRARLAALQGGLAGASWIDGDAMHITLRFLGDVSEPDARDVGSALAEIYDPTFDLNISGIGYFERRGLVHTVWARVEKSDALLHLHSKIESAVVRCGFDPEQRKFAPHVTLARMKGTPAERIGPWLESSGVAVAPPFGAHNSTLYQSERGHGGARYTPLSEYELFTPLD